MSDELVAKVNEINIDDFFERAHYGDTEHNEQLQQEVANDISGENTGHVAIKEPLQHIGDENGQSGVENLGQPSINDQVERVDEDQVITDGDVDKDHVDLILSDRIELTRIGYFCDLNEILLFRIVNIQLKGS